MKNKQSLCLWRIHTSPTKRGQISEGDKLLFLKNSQKISDKKEPNFEGSKLSQSVDKF